MAQFRTYERPPTGSHATHTTQNRADRRRRRCRGRLSQAPERTADAKRTFQKIFGAEAHRSDLYPHYFPQAMLEKLVATQPERLLARIVALMRAA